MTYVTNVPASGQPNRMPVSGDDTEAAAPGTGNWIPKNGTYSTYQLIAAGAATVVIEATNDKNTVQGLANNAVLLGTITLAGAGSDGFVTGANWRYVRARLTAASAPASVLQGG